jgi:hypothetical protein
MCGIGKRRTVSTALAPMSISILNRSRPFLLRHHHHRHPAVTSHLHRLPPVPVPLPVALPLRLAALARCHPMVRENNVIDSFDISDTFLSISVATTGAAATSSGNSTSTFEFLGVATFFFTLTSLISLLRSRSCTHHHWFLFWSNYLS